MKVGPLDLSPHEPKHTRKEALARTFSSQVNDLEPFLDQVDAGNETLSLEAVLVELVRMSITSHHQHDAVSHQPFEQVPKDLHNVERERDENERWSRLTLTRGLTMASVISVTWREEARSVSASTIDLQQCEARTWNSSKQRTVASLARSLATSPRWSPCF
jgi:hypothetical protein